MTRSKLLASLTGSIILFGLVIASAPRTLQSYFSSIVRAQVGSVTVADFQAPELEILLHDGEQVFQGPTEVIEPANPVTLIAVSTHNIPFITDEGSPQFILLTIKFSGEIGSYQSDPCLTFQLEEQVVYSMLCQSVADTEFHTLFIPVGRLGATSAKELRVLSQLPENVTVSLSEVNQSTWFLTAETQLMVTATDATQTQITSSVGTLVKEDEHFVIQQESLPENQTVLLILQATDQYGNGTEVQQLVHRVSAPSQDNIHTVKYFLETDGSYHALVQPDSSIKWYQPTYLKNSDSSGISSRHFNTVVWHPMVRYSEPESVITHTKRLQLSDSFLQPYPLIETE